MLSGPRALVPKITAALAGLRKRKLILLIAHN